MGFIFGLLFLGMLELKQWIYIKNAFGYEVASCIYFEKLNISVKQKKSENKFWGF